jgi:NADH-quinone oxidoreductase subunit L
MAATLIILTIGLPWCGALLIWIAGFWQRRIVKSTPSSAAQLHSTRLRATKQLNILAVAFSAAAGVAALALLPFLGAQAVIRIPMGDYFGELTFIPDGLGVFLAIIATVIGCLAVIFSVDYMRSEAHPAGDPQLGRYYFLVLFFIGAMASLVLTGSLLFLFVFWEITALCSYGLISFYNDDPKAVAGGIKALIITQIGGVGLLVGALAVYAYTGSFQIEALLAGASRLPAPLLALVAFGFLIAAAAKSAQVPFHTWLPDAMEAPTPVSALIHAATMVNAGVYLLARFYPAFAEVPYWRLAVITVGVVTALLAALMAIVAVDLKRVLAYSTVSQLGYMVYAVGAGGVFASQFHLLSHAVFKALLFLGAGAIIHALGTRDMRQMGHERTHLPFVRVVFIIGAMALAGIPILNGFWSKELVLEAGFFGGPAWAFGILLLVTGLTAFYASRMVWMVFYAPSSPQTEEVQPHPGIVHDASTAMRVALAPLAVGALTTWLLAGPLSRALADSLPHHVIEINTTSEMMIAVLLAPQTWGVLVLIGLGLAAWQTRRSLGWLGRQLGWLGRLAEDGFGFEKINQWIIHTTLDAASSLRLLQTGQLNWNLVGVLAGLVVVLAWLAWAL